MKHTRGDVIRWNGPAWAGAAIFLGAGLAGSVMSGFALVAALTDPSSTLSPWWLYLFGVFGGICALWGGRQKVRELQRSRTAGTAHHE